MPAAGARPARHLHPSVSVSFRSPSLEAATRGEPAAGDRKAPGPVSGGPRRPSLELPEVRNADASRRLAGAPGQDDDGAWRREPGAFSRPAGDRIRPRPAGRAPGAAVVT